MRNISFFVSSTFNDMQSERDLIRKKIAPEIEERLGKFGYTVEFIDLRWGIDTQNLEGAEANLKILRTCFEEIKRSRPFFIGLIGERYGWVPSSEDINLAIAANDLPFAEGDLKVSVTELEIRCALATFAKTDKCLFYFRDPVDYGKNSAAAGLFVSKGEEREKLEGLKERIKKGYGKQVKRYSGEWDDSSSSIVGLDDFEKTLIDDIMQVVTAEIRREDVPDNAIEESINVTDSFIALTARLFSGRETERQYIQDFVGSSHSDSRVLVLSGNSGCGKSALMASACFTLAGSGVQVVPFFVGADEFSSSVENMLATCNYRMSAMLGGDKEEQLKASSGMSDDMLKRFYLLLNTLSLRGKTVLLIDAINQFNRTPLDEKLKWLNLFAINPSVKIILSATSDYYQTKFLKSAHADIYNLDYFSADDVKKVSQNYFTINHKQIGDDLLKLIYEKRTKAQAPCREPVYLLTLLEELNGLEGEDFRNIKQREKELNLSPAEAISSYMAEIIKSAPMALNDLLLEVMARAAQKIGKVCDIFACSIAVSRRGLGEKFIEKICLKGGYEFESSDFSYFRKLFKRQLVQRENGAWDFGHAIVKGCFLNYFDEDFRQNVTRLIADCLEEEEDGAFKSTEYAYYLTLLDELDKFPAYYAVAQDKQAVRESLAAELQSPSLKTSAVGKIFEDERCAAEMRALFVGMLEEKKFNLGRSEIYANLVLNSVYSRDYAQDSGLLSVILGTYSAIGAVAAGAGNYALASDYYKLALSVAEKLGEEGSGKLPSLYSALSECAFDLGNGIRAKRYFAAAKTALEGDLNKTPQSGRDVALLNTYLKECQRILSGFLQKRRAIGGYLSKMQAVVGRGALGKEESALWSSRILYLAAKAGCEGDFEREITLAENYQNGQGSDIAYGEICINCARYYLASSPQKAESFIDKAIDYLGEVLKISDDKAAYGLFADALQVKIFIKKLRKEDCAELYERRLNCLERLNLLEPGYVTLKQYFALHPKKSGRESDNASELKKLYKLYAGGHVSAEQKTSKKILNAIVAIVFGIYLLIFPLLFTLFRGTNVFYEFLLLFGDNFDFGTNQFWLFANFAVIGAFESVCNMLLCFVVYAVMQLVHIKVDLSLRRFWLIRACIYLCFAAAAFVIFYFVLGYFESIFIVQKDYFQRNVLYFAVLVSEFLLIAYFISECMELFSKELSVRYIEDDYNRFVTDYKLNLANCLIDVCFIAVPSVIFFLFSAKAKGLLIMPTEFFVIFLCVVGAVKLLKILRLSALYFVKKVKYEKIYKG